MKLSTVSRDTSSGKRRTDVLKVDTIEVVRCLEVCDGLDESGTVLGSSDVGRIVLGASPAANGDEDLDVLNVANELGDAQYEGIAITFS